MIFNISAYGNRRDNGNVLTHIETITIIWANRNNLKSIAMKIKETFFI